MCCVSLHVTFPNYIQATIPGVLNYCIWFKYDPIFLAVYFTDDRLLQKQFIGLPSWMTSIYWRKQWQY